MFPKFGGTTRYDKIEIIIPNSYTKSSIDFPQDLAQLRSDKTWDIAVQAIETFSKFDQALSQSGNVMPTEAQLIATTMTLYVDSEESIFEVPLAQLHRSIATDAAGKLVAHVRDLQVFNNLQVSWEKCFLTNTAANGWNTGGAGTFSFEFGVHYLRLPAGTLAKLKNIQHANYCNLPPQ